MSRRRGAASRASAEAAERSPRAWRERARAYGRTRVVLALAVLQALVTLAAALGLLALTSFTLPVALLAGLTFSMLINSALARFTVAELRRQGGAAPRRR